MLNKKEISYILLISIIFSFLISLNQGIIKASYIFISILLILLINIFAKKITAYYLDSEIEIRLWEIKRYGFKSHHHFKKPFPAGIIFPLISKIIFFPINSFIWMASLVFSVEAKTYRAARRFGIYEFSEITEYHIGLIAAMGIIANLLFALIGYLIEMPPEMEFAKLSLIFTFFNILPLSRLDGNKIFFGSLALWSLLASIITISLISMILIV